MPGPDRPHLPAAALLAGLAVLAASTPARAADAAALCSLVLSSEPARLEAGSPRAALLRVRGPDGAAGPPLLAASLGRLEAPRAEGDGWVAEWRAPEAGAPGVAILGALGADGAACGFVAVPLHGVGDAVVRTSPGASVAVRIADRTFGPARADASGLALVPVEVPPGVDAAFHGSRRIPLEVPPAVHLAILVGQALTPADRAAEVTVLVFAVTVEGMPRPGPPPVLTATAGALDTPEAAGPGAWRVRWRLPPGPAGAAGLSAQLPGEPAFQATLLRVAGPPAVATLALDQASATAGQEAPVTATVALVDAAGNAADGDVVAEVDAGEVGPAERVEEGRYRLRWAVPGRLDGRRKAELTVRAGDASTRTSLALAPGAPAGLTLAAASPTVTADGHEAVELVATVSDAGGNPVDEPPTVRTASAGEVGPPRQAGPGRFAMTYRPRRAPVPGADDVVVELPPLSARARLRLRPPTGPLGLAAGLGAAIGPGGWLGLQAGAEVSAWRWLGDQEAGLALAAAFTRLRDDGAVAAGTGTVPFSGEVRTLALLLSAGWRRAAGQRLALRVTAGGGVARVESLVAAGGGPLIPEAGWVPAASGAAAVGLSVGRGRAFLEARATWLGDPGLSSLRGSPSPFSLTLGYELDAI